MPDTAPLYRIKADLFKALAHPTRIQVLEVLSAGAPAGTPVSELLAVTGCEASQLSQQLAVLKRHGLVTSSRTGNTVRYRLSQPVVAELLVVARAFLLTSLAGAGEQLAAARDLPPLPGASARTVLEQAAGTPASAMDPAVDPDVDPAVDPGADSTTDRTATVAHPGPAAVPPSASTTGRSGARA